MKLGEIIKKFRDEHKLSMDKFAEQSGLTKGYISMLEKNEHPKSKKPIIPTEDTLIKVAKGMGVDIEVVLNNLDENQEIQINTSPQNMLLPSEELLRIDRELKEPRHSKWISHGEKLLDEQIAESTTINEPLYEYKVFEKLAAGNGYTYFNDGNFDIVFHDEKMDHDFASWVFGDSMEPTYLNGEVVLIKQTGFDYDGAIYAVDWDGQTYIKKVYKEETGLRLVSLNKKYADKFAPYDEDPRIIGLVVGHFMPMDI